MFRGEHRKIRQAFLRAGEHSGEVVGALGQGAGPIARIEPVGRGFDVGLGGDADPMQDIAA